MAKLPNGEYETEEEARQARHDTLKDMPKPTYYGLNPSQAIVDELVDFNSMIFVFGSNEAGRHGAGAAKFAHQAKGAVYNIGYGHYGQSFDLPTMDKKIRPLKLSDIRGYVEAFKLYARIHPELTFQVTALGCGLAGRKHEDIAPMFDDATMNCYFDTAWKPWLPNARFWGTF